MRAVLHAVDANEEIDMVVYSQIRERHRYGHRENH